MTTREFDYAVYHAVDFYVNLPETRREIRECEARIPALANKLRVEVERIDKIFKR